MYRVDDPSINHINYAQRCRTWFVNEPLPDVYLNELLRRLCPCSILQAIRDRRFRLNLNTFYARSRFSRRVFSGERIYQRCCYSLAGKSFGSLITNYPFGSSFIFRNTTLQARNNEALTDCCMRSSLCSLYLKKRPINKCVGYKAPRKAWFWGDPHNPKYFTIFGQLWMINASDSLFTYSNGLSASNYSDPNFTPIFGQNIQALFANNTELYNQAVAQCGNNSECLFDAAVVSKDTSQIYQDTSNQLENFPPQISGLTTYNVTYGNMFTTTLNITDLNNGDIVTVEMTNPPINSHFDRQTYTFTWNISTYENISLTFVATDNKGARSELAPQIIMCYCSNNGTCDYAAEMGYC
ncbi:uncharacterized protein TRIADDRAFT_62820 [Trichoplax adhaerens]|uniref:AMOP domain-containing protein n=1 Tax=Trichoplax adhaerens TaxID=10228 RepID=B3SEZ5_TRIAD|nr:hypothetical protein TRIADDRAFT_62820 [Trichoplax adhaerens]EDV18699.1 hypothetical protein TRIADDRAFT_62820 [Trichoplax adhaerens]|eukprot:XP_002118814.1 hypothetical protein TRIADDRAFT_62820 [Trichoplax adhaerens]